MDLILWRHAEAEELSPGGDDLQRVLTGRGQRQAQRMGHWLERQLPAGARLLVSPAQRTLQTAEVLQRRARVCAELAPNGSVDDLLEVARWPHGKGCTLIVGHQPTLGRTVARLMGLATGECAVKKGSLWWLRYREREGQGEAVLLTVQSPELL